MALSSRETYRLTLKEYPDVLNVVQIGEILGICTKTVYRLMKTGEISFIKIGRVYRIPKVMLLEYLKMIQKKDNCA